MSTTEATPLLHSESSENDVEGRADTQQPWLRKQLNPQTLSAVSILWCIYIYAAGYFISFYLNSNSYYHGLPASLDIQLALAAQLWFWTAFVSFLNYARLRRSGIELPWWLNIIVDVLVFFSGFFISLLYFAVNASIGPSRCIVYGRPDRDHPYGRPRRDEVCEARENVARSLGTVVMVGLLFLSLTHALLLVVRLRRLPSIPNVVRRPSSWREEGWFIGIGRGPLNVRTVPQVQEASSQGV